MKLDTAKIRSGRERRGLSMEQASTEAKLGGKQNWYAIESGRRTMVTAETLYRIARVIRRPMVSLLVKEEGD